VRRALTRASSSDVAHTQTFLAMLIDELEVDE